MPLGDREAGIVLASMGLFFPSQAPGLVLGTMPAEGREEILTHLWPAKEDNRGKGGTTSKLLLPQEHTLSPKPRVIAYSKRKKGASGLGLGWQGGPWPFKRSDSILWPRATQTKEL